MYYKYVDGGHALHVGSQTPLLGTDCSFPLTEGVQKNMIGMLSSVKLPLELEHATEHSFRNGQSGTNTEYGVNTESVRSTE